MGKKLARWFATLSRSSRSIGCFITMNLCDGYWSEFPDAHGFSVLPTGMYGQNRHLMCRVGGKIHIIFDERHHRHISTMEIETALSGGSSGMGPPRRLQLRREGTGTEANRVEDACDSQHLALPHHCSRCAAQRGPTPELSKASHASQGEPRCRASRGGRVIYGLTVKGAPTQEPSTENC